MALRELPLFKTGTSFGLVVRAVEIIGAAKTTDYTGWQARSQLRTKAGTLVFDFAPAMQTDGTLYLRAAPAQNAAWPAGELLLDVLIRDPSGNTDGSETFVQPIERGPTQWQ